MGEAVAISHYVKPPSKAVLHLIAKHGADDARKHALRELRNARRARSRMRFTFRTAVVAEINAHCPTPQTRAGPKDRHIEALRETSTSMGASIADATRH
jgi:hypothetical protein